MGEFVDKGELRPPRDDAVEVHLIEPATLVLEMLARQHFEALKEGLGFLSAMGLDYAEDDIDAVSHLGACRLQHLIGLADAGRGADEDLQPADILLFPPSGFEQGFRRRSLIEILTLVRH